jgi:hypothetical protein
MFPQTAINVMSHSNGKMSDKDFRHFVRYRDNVAHLEMDSASFNHFYLDVLADVYPEARFLFFIRDCYSWMDSVFNMYIGNGALAASTGITEQWMKDYTQFWLGVPANILQNPDEIRENAAHCVSSMFHSWQVSNDRILELLPEGRSLILNTNELSNEIDTIAGFIGVSVEDLNINRKHSYKANKKYNILKSLEYDIVKTICDDMCSELMQRFFPRYELCSYLAGERPTRSSRYDITQDRHA